ncbi:L,D-transpeptidase [Catenulispora yoronensis]
MGPASSVTTTPTAGSHTSAGAPEQTVSSAPGTPSATRPTAIGGRTTAVVDLNQHELTLVDRNGLVMKVLRMTGGSPDHPTPAGTYTVTAKKETETISSQTAGVDGYSIKVNWVVHLDGGGPTIMAATWYDDTVIGVRNQTRGDIGLTSPDAQWLFSNLTVGDHVQVR